MNRAMIIVRAALASDARLGWLVFLGALLLYLPGAGSYGLWDPWETHYGEVARQMTARGDFISLWWPGSPRETAVFQTKPVLSYWLMSLGMQVAGIGGAGAPAGQMALGYARPSGRCARRSACWARWASGRSTWSPPRLAGRRAGVLAALCTATLPAVRAGRPPGHDRHGLRGPDDPGPGPGRPGAGRDGRDAARSAARARARGGCPGPTTRCSTPGWRCGCW